MVDNNLQECIRACSGKLEGWDRVLEKVPTARIEIDMDIAASCLFRGAAQRGNLDAAGKTERAAGRVAMNMDIGASCLAREAAQRAGGHFEGSVIKQIRKQMLSNVTDADVGSVARKRSQAGLCF